MFNKNPVDLDNSRLTKNDVCCAFRVICQSANLNDFCFVSRELTLIDGFGLYSAFDMLSSCACGLHAQ